MFNHTELKRAVNVKFTTTFVLMIHDLNILYHGYVSSYSYLYLISFQLGLNLNSVTK